MIRRSTFILALISSAAFFAATSASAQQGGMGGSGGVGVRDAGSANTLSTEQGYGLDTRFMGSGFDTFTQGSSALGTTTAGARAGSAGYGQSTVNALGGSMGNMQGRGTSSFGLGNFGGLNSFGGLGGLGAYGLSRNLFGNRNMQQTTQGTKTIRTRTKLGFTQPLPSATAVTTKYTDVMQRVLARGDYGKGDVSMKMEGQVAVLQGTVESDHARNVAERLALLEPGISEVRNELIVRSAEPTRETSPTRTGADQRQ